MGIRKTAVEPVRLRMKMELKGRRSLTEPEGWSDEAKPDEWSPKVADGRLTKAEPEGRGSPVELVG